MWQPTWNGHFKGVLKVRALEVLLVHIRVFYHVVDVVDVAPRSILWDLNFHHVAPLDNGYLQDKEFGVLSNMMNSPGMNCGCHHPGVSGPPVAQGPPTMPFQSGVVNTHQGQDPVPNPTPSTPLPSSGMDISQLEERLGEAINKKFESMTETLRASMSTSMENTSTTATNALAKAPGSVIPPDPEPPMPSAPDGTTATLPASASLDAEPRSRDRNLSPSYSSHRRSLHRRRAHSDRHHQGDHGSTSPRSRHHDRLLPRAADHAKPTNQTYSSGKDRSHPIYHRSNAMRTRTSTSGTSGYRQIHSDIHQTVYSRSPRENYGRDSRHQQDRATSSITLSTLQKNSQDPPVLHGSKTRHPPLSSIPI